MAPRRILIAAPGPASGEELGSALRRRGYRVQVAPDASRALELAVLRTPDLVLLDVNSPLLDAQTFVRILRANRRTENVPVLLTGAKAREAGRAGLPPKPQDPGEVAARVERVFRRAEEPAAAVEAGLEGDLVQLPLVDLLQILAVNRRSGRLALGRGGTRGTIALSEGRITDASAGKVRGEKALGRLLPLREGAFAFAPGAPGPGPIARRVEELVLDGLRQADEKARLGAALPGPAERLSLAVVPSAVPDGLLPATSEVLQLLRTPRTLEELLDLSAAPDLDLLRALAILLERGFVRRGPAALRGPEKVPVLAEAAIGALRARLAGRPGRTVPTGKVALCGGGPLTRRTALARFGALAGFRLEAAGAPVELGTLGTFEVGDGVQVDLVALPSDPALWPLWRPLAAGALGVLVLPPADGLSEPLLDLASAARLRLFVCGPPGKATAPSALSGAEEVGADPAEALRALLERAGG